MKVFVTGATGFIGSAVVQELLRAGHQVTGLTRSDKGALQLQNAGASVHRGSLEDLDSLKSGAATADGVIHLAFTHTFPGILFAMHNDVKAINAIGSALANTGKPLVVAGAILGFRPGHTLTEDYTPDYSKVPRKSEETVLSWSKRGVRASVVRLPPTVHGEGDKGFLPSIVASARKNKASAFTGNGRQRWPAVHVLDAARLFRLVLENGTAAGIYHGVGDEGVPFGDLALAIGKGVGVPAVSKSMLGAIQSLGFLGYLSTMDCPASSRITQEKLGWSVAQPGVFEDLKLGKYFETPS